MTTEQLKAIRPRKDDFYSRRLYSWLKWFSEKRFDRTHCGVKTPPSLTPESILAQIEVRKSKRSGELHIVLPFGNSLLGSRIGTIRRSCRNEAYSYTKDKFFSPVLGFWKSYVDGGTCFLNPEHYWLDGPDAWEYSPNSKIRTCRWCGLKQKLRSKTVKKTETWWEEVPAKDKVENPH